jgi:hypothetical protein
MPIYAREKVRFVWLVDPIDRTLEIYRLEGPSWLFTAAFAGSEKVRAVPWRRRREVPVGIRYRDRRSQTEAVDLAHRPQRVALVPGPRRRLSLRVLPGTALEPPQPNAAPARG